MKFREKIKGSFNKKYIKNGSYSMVISAVFIAVIVVINMIVGAVPSKYSEIDVSDQKLFSIGKQTEKFLKNLDKDVTIYQVAASGSEDETIKKGRRVLKITVSEKNIDIGIRDNRYCKEDYEKGFLTEFSKIRRNETSPFTYHKTLNYGDCITEKRNAQKKSGTCLSP